MDRYKIAPAYEEQYLEIERPQPLADQHIEQLQQDVLNGKLDKDVTDQVYTNFKQEMTSWLFSSKLNKITGFDVFDRIDIINGCTQFIDNLYIHGPVQYLKGDYRYHSRLGIGTATEVDKLHSVVPLVIAMPFPNTGAVHNKMTEILDICLARNIPVHIDGSWVTCCKDIEFDFSHPAIRSVGISLSKGLGLGWNRVGLRWTKNISADSISIMNEFNMNLRAPAMIGLHFLRNLPVDYLWNTYGEIYYKVCKDFNLTPTNSIYLAIRDSQPVGVSPLIRYLENE